MCVTLLLISVLVAVFFAFQYRDTKQLLDAEYEAHFDTQRELANRLARLDRYEALHRRNEEHNIVHPLDGVRE